MQSNFPDRDSLFSPEDPGPELSEYLLILARNTRLVIKAVLAVFIVSLVAYFLWPKTYTATAKILPPAPQNASSALLRTGFSDLADLVGIDMGSGGGDFYLSILQSRTLSDRIIDKFDLMQVYGEGTRLDTYKVMGDMISIGTDSGEGVIVINVNDRDPERASSIANAYVEELKRLNDQLKLTSAGQRRLFLEKELKKSRESLFLAEENLKKFQQENELIKIDDQARVSIETISQLQAQIVAGEIQLAALLSYQTEENFEVKELRRRIARMQAELKKLEVPSASANPEEGILIPTSKASELALNYGRLLREVKFQEAVYSGLIQQLELARFDEAKEGATIQVLDQAVPPDKHSKPRLFPFTLIPTFLAGVIACAFAFLREYVARLSSEERQKWAKIKQQFSFSSRKEIQ